MRPLRKLSLLAAALVLAGCAQPSSYQPPTLELPAASTPAPQPINQRWWQALGDSQLNALIEEAFVHNNDLASAAANIALARAQLGGQDAQLQPNVQLGSNVSRQQLSTQQSGGGPRRSNSLGLSATLSYEVDLWGRLASSRDAAQAELTASQAARDSVRLALAADVARRYIELRSLDQQLALTQQTLQARQRTAELQNKRYQGGSISELESSQAQAESADTAARIPVLQQQIALSRNALAQLLGRTPKALLHSEVQRLAASLALPSAPVPPTGLAAQLLQRRPDLQQAWLQLQAADARVSAAQAQFFPSLRLTGAQGTQSNALRDLLSGPAALWSLGLGLTQPLWDGGRIQADVDAASARRQQAQVQYVGAVQAAFREVADALAKHSYSSELVQAREAQVKSLQQTLNLAEKRYQGGYSSYLDLLDAQRNLFQAQLSLNSAQAEQLQALIDLYQALGGGWENTSTPSG